MNKDRIAGIWQEIVGSVNQAWGEWIGDSPRAAAGRRDQVAGQARQDSAMAREHAARELREFQHHNRNWYL